MTTYEKILQMWSAFNIGTVEDLDIRLNSFRVQFAYNSAKIENPEVTFHATRDIFEDGIVKDFKGNPDTLTEISNQQKCYTFLLPKIIAKEAMTVDLIKQAHEITTMGTYDHRRYFVLGERPGQFKKNDFVVGMHDVGALPEQVQPEMADLLAEINSVCGMQDAERLFKTATYFHMRFESIHPFADGNGRVGRTMMNYFLMTHNHPPLIVFEEDRGRYYEALEHFGEHENLDLLHTFLLHQLEKTWIKALARQMVRDKL